MMDIFRKYKLFLLVTTSILFLAFAFDLFGGMTPPAFTQNYKDSEALISNQIACRGSIYGGQLIQAKGNNIGAAVTNCDASTTEAYSSQFGLQGRLYTLGYRALSKIIHIQLIGYIAFAQIMTALISALCFALLVLWIRLNIGFMPAIISTFFISVSPMLVGFARNLYWALPLMVLPLIYVLFAYSPDLKKSKKIIFWIILAALFYIRFLCGYEYVTSFPIMAAAGVIYYLYISGGKPRVYIKELALVLLVSVIGFSAALGTHILSLSHYTHSTSSAIKVVKNRAFARIIDTGDYLSVPYSNYKATLNDSYQITNSYLHLDEPRHHTSLAWAVGVAILNYSLLPVVDSPVTLSQPFATYIESFAIFTVLLVLLFVYRRKWVPRDQIVKVEALFAASLTGLAAYLSWLVIARPHALVHAHINGVLMYLPAALFGYMIFGYYISSQSDKLLKKYKK